MLFLLSILKHPPFNGRMFFIFTLTNTKGRLSNEKHPLIFVLLKKLMIQVLLLQLQSFSDPI